MIFYLENDLDQKESAMFERHLSICAKCKHQYESFSNIYNTILHDKVDNVDPWFFTKIHNKLASEKRNFNLTKILNLKPALLAASVAIPIVIGVLLGSNQNTISSISEEQVEEVITNEIFYAGVDPDIINPAYTEIYFTE